jgi:uncharacterized protein YwqG
VPGLPTVGLLQWFTESDSTYGLTFDNTAGIAGFEVRWYDDLSRPSVATPSGPTPPDIEFSPIDGPRGFVFTVSRTFPPFEAVPPGLDVDPLLDEYGRALAAANVENEYWAEFLQHHQYVWARYVRGDRSPLTGYWHSSAIGGFADFTQADPRGTGNYARVLARRSCLAAA